MANRKFFDFSVNKVKMLNTSSIARSMWFSFLWKSFVFGIIIEGFLITSPICNSSIFNQDGNALKKSTFIRLEHKLKEEKKLQRNEEDN